MEIWVIWNKYLLETLKIFESLKLRNFETNKPRNQETKKARD